MTPPGEMPRWLSRTLTWVSGAAILLAAIHFFPHLFYPKLVMALASPDQVHEAQVLVRPSNSFIVGGYVTLFTGDNAQIVVRVASRATGRVLYQDVIAERVETEWEAEKVEIDWKTDGTVRFNFNGRQSVRVYEPPLVKKESER